MIEELITQLIDDYNNPISKTHFKITEDRLYDIMIKYDYYAIINNKQIIQFTPAEEYIHNDYI